MDKRPIPGINTKFSHVFTCRLASLVQIIQDPTADFKVTVSGQFASRIFAGGLAARGAYLEDFKAVRACGQ